MSWLYDEYRNGVDRIKALEKENERLKKELDDMKVKYKGCCGTTLS